VGQVVDLGFNSTWNFDRSNYCGCRNFTSSKSKRVFSAFRENLDRDFALSVLFHGLYRAICDFRTLAMPSKDEVFHQVLLAEGFGGRYNYEAETEQAWFMPYDVIRQSIQVEAQIVRSHPERLKDLPEVYAGIANCTKINACAFKAGDTYYVAICYGAIRLLKATFLRLLSRPDVFPWLGDISRTPTWQRFPALPRDSSLLAWIPTEGKIG
jgi:hypothetical protein